MQEFQLATRRKDVKAQLDVIERSKGLPSFNADCFAKLAALCKGGYHARLSHVQRRLCRLCIMGSPGVSL